MYIFIPRFITIQTTKKNISCLQFYFSSLIILKIYIPCLSRTFLDFLPDFFFFFSLLSKAEQGEQRIEIIIFLTQRKAIFGKKFLITEFCLSILVNQAAFYGCLSQKVFIGKDQPMHGFNNEGPVLNYSCLLSSFVYMLPSFMVLQFASVSKMFKIFSVLLIKAKKIIIFYNNSIIHDKY